MDLNALGTCLGFSACVLVIAITIRRQRRFEAADLGSFATAFLAGTNIPPALFLCSYAIFPDDPQSVTTKLHGLEKFVSFAGLSLLLVSLISLWGLYRKAYELQVDSAPATTPPANEASAA
jgi:hypothetical protein